MSVVVSGRKCSSCFLHPALITRPALHLGVPPSARSHSSAFEVYQSGSSLERQEGQGIQRWRQGGRTELLEPAKVNLTQFRPPRQSGRFDG